MTEVLFDGSSGVLLRYGVICLFVGVGVVFSDRLSRSVGLSARASTLVVLALGAMVWYGWSGTYLRWTRLFGTALAVLLPLAVCVNLFREIVWDAP
ncbi:hypothetical protein [Halorubrum sp. Atlit-26R]|uniref:hypothetical protein n=1 Tax=Halorubrum sp. Atlit-26R TaxID=2282128 RepID=UPI000EF17E5C|nr:hypothetical protein [Halorubrum sp. Atlit-26R]RLM72986.1 hypothetical protein DVK07_05670 [Halorubrum sp. Atlit-26R]